MKGWGGRGALVCMGGDLVVEMPTSVQVPEARWSEHTSSLCSILTCQICSVFAPLFIESSAVGATEN